MLDRDLAALYGVENRVLKQAVRRNIDRFPFDFMFELSKKEYQSLRSQNVILKRGHIQNIFPLFSLEVVSKPQIRFKGKAQADRESAAYMGM